MSSSTISTKTSCGDDPMVIVGSSKSSTRRHHGNSLSSFHRIIFHLFVILLIHSFCVESSSIPSSTRSIPSTTTTTTITTTNNSSSTSFSTKSTTAYVPVFIMMPLNTVNNDGSLNNPSQIRANLQKVKSVGTDGIMIDVWWGICEQKSPQSYNFTAYQQLFTMCQQIGLKVEPVMSFHQCGTNIGDAAYIPLPNWVLQVGQWNPDIFYTDQNGHRDREYLSLGVDNVAIFPTSVPGKNRTAVDIYSDFMTAFRNTFSSFIQSGVIDVIEIGLGPAGEMRYPSYQLQNNLWSFPGIGAFQCYDKYMLNNLAMAAKNVGHPEWGTAGPNDAGYYNSMPYQTGFFSDNTYNNYASNYGQFFLNWYSGMLIQHGSSILQRARSIFGKNAKLAAKIAGIHWWYFTDSHAAELTAGYYNIPSYDGYGAIAQMFSQYNIDFEFTCMEMIDSQQPSNCACGPAELVALTRSTAWKYGLDYGGENALDIEGNTQANAQIVKQSSSSGKAISGFTYLRMSDSLLNSSYNFNVYAQLVNALHQLETNTKSSNSNDVLYSHSETTSKKLSILIQELKKIQGTNH